MNRSVVVQLMHVIRGDRRQRERPRRKQGDIDRLFVGANRETINGKWKKGKEISAAQVHHVNLVDRTLSDFLTGLDVF